MHWCKTLDDAISWAPGTVLCRIKAQGETLHEVDKSVSRRRKVVWMLDVAPIIERYMYQYTVRALKRAKVKHKSAWKAIEVYKKYLDGKAYLWNISEASCDIPLYSPRPATNHAYQLVQVLCLSIPLKGKWRAFLRVCGFYANRVKGTRNVFAEKRRSLHRTLQRRIIAEAKRQGVWRPDR
jgi:hypothetical protein